MTRSDGFTLIEVLASAGLLVIVLLGVASMSLTAQAQLARGAEQTMAAALGQQRIEWLRNQGPASSDLAAGTTSELLGGDYDGYTRTTLVQDDTPIAGIKQVTVTTVTPKGIAVSVISLVVG